MTDLQRTLKQIEASLCQIPTAGQATLCMADALRLLVKAQELANEKPKEGAENADCDRN